MIFALFVVLIHEWLYTLAYIDKMWEIILDEPFPAEIRL